MMITEGKLSLRTRSAAIASALLAVAFAVACACTMPAASAQAAEPGLQAVGASTVEAQAADYDTSWYYGKTSPYTIENVKQLKGLAYLVNNGVDTFEGKEICLNSSSGRLAFEEGESIEPIGDADNPFKGVFDGNDNVISNMTLNIGSRLSHIGLFGNVEGENSAIKNVKLQGGSFTVSNSDAGKTVSLVGAIAGNLEGSIENCSSSTEVYAINNGDVPAKEGKTAEELCTIIYVGGLVGHLGHDMVGCEHGNATLGISSTSNVSTNVPYIAGFIGGLVGMQGDDSDASVVTELSDCTNRGELAFNVSGSGGLDRFQERMYSSSTMVGGIAGYAMGDVSNCSNYADLQTGIVKDGVLQAGWGASTTGGIVGSLRGPTLVSTTSATGVVGSSDSDPGYDVWVNSDGKTEPQTLVVKKCQNTGAIVGLTSVAGICGSTGAFTKVIGCSNTGQVDGTRWNKPCPAGIVGISNGDIGYCSNTGRIATTTGAGFYASGITALLTTYNTTTTEADLLLDAPELYGCYITGSIVSAEAGYRSAVIAGENDGYIHDNCFLPDLTVDKVVDEEVFGDKNYHSSLVDADQNRGTLANNYELTSEELRGSKGISLLNYVSASDGSWEYYYVPNPDETGYPLQNWRASGTPSSQVDFATALTGATITVAENAQYCTTESITPLPSITVETSDGTTLYQNADFKVIPETGARTVSSGGAYQATLEGMNGYTGTYGQTVAYDVDKCDISTCKILAGTQTFNWEPQKPAWVKVVDKYGSALPESEYEWDRVGFDPDNTTASNGKYVDYTNVHYASYKYDIKATAKEGGSYTGETVQAAFHIDWALLMYEEAGTSSSALGCQYDKVVWGDQEWDYGEAMKTKGLVKIKYTGAAIEPTVSDITYLGKSLRDGTNVSYWKDPLAYDFRYIYGNANAEKVDASGETCVNATGSNEEDLAVMTVRFTAGGNFTNFSNVYFEITPASIVDDVSISGINSTYTYAGSPVTVSPVLTYNGTTLVQGTDYTLTYVNNNTSGNATVTITGKGNYTGSVTRSFTIDKGSQTITASNKKKTVKQKKLKKKKITINAAKLCKVSAKTAITYSGKANKKKKKFTVSKNGVITVKKGTPKGTYKVKITAKAAGNDKYLAAKTKTFTVTVKVK